MQKLAKNIVGKIIGKVIPRPRRIKEWLTGARLQRLRARQASLGKSLDELRDTAMKAQQEYADLYNTNPLRRLTLKPRSVGGYDMTQVYDYLDMKGPAREKAERVYRALKPSIDAADVKAQALGDRFWRRFHRVRGHAIDMVHILPGAGGTHDAPLV